MRTQSTRFIALLLIIILLPTVYGVQTSIDKMKPRLKGPEGLLMLPSANILKPLSLNQSALLSDILWLKTIQYVGEKNQSYRGWKWFSHTINIITDLNPDFRLAYQFAGLILTIFAGNPEESTRILEKGIKNTPDNWYLYFLIGYNYFDFFGDYGKAAYYIERASILPGAPDYLKFFASRLYSSSGKPENGIIFIEKLLETTDDEETRTRLISRLNSLCIERDINYLNTKVEVFLKLHNRFPSSLHELLSSGLISSIPKDPFGKEYVFDNSEKKVKSRNINERLRIFKTGKD